MDYIKSHPPGKALDLGCGTGTNVITLAEHGWQAYGVDFVSRAIHLARQKAHKTGLRVEFFCDDVTILKNITSQFDLILDIGCYHSILKNKVPIYVNNIENLLKPKGNYLLYGFCSPDPASTGLTPFHLEALNKALQVVDRHEGWDGERPSVWLRYQKPDV